MAFDSLGLSDSLLSALADLGYAAPTPVQEEAIPLILDGGDLLAAAQTGSGKTAAFALPILQGLGDNASRSRGASALVLVPTRELATQVGAAFERYGKDLPQPVRVLAVLGGVGYDDQIKTAQAGVDIVVATPGRLIDLVERGALSLGSIKTLVLDEADRLLALGFADELNAVLALLPAERQNLLFSATFPKAVVTLADGLLSNPRKLTLEAESTQVASIHQRAIEVERNSRTGLLRHLLESESWSRVLVFVGTKRRADNVTAKLLKHGISAAALHGDLSQFKRERALERFKQSKIRVLMATDVAARGIDIVQLPCVVNYDLPRSPADYVHRIGRTGRAGEAGLAVNFVSAEDDVHFKLIEKRNGLNLERERIEGFVPETWDPAAASTTPKGTAPVKGKRKSKKDKLREAAAQAAPPLAPQAAPAASQEEPPQEEPPQAEPSPEEPTELPVSSPWAQALKKVKSGE